MHNLLCVEFMPCVWQVFALPRTGGVGGNLIFVSQSYANYMF